MPNSIPPSPLLWLPYTDALAKFFLSHCITRRGNISLCFMLHVYLYRESQPPLDGLNENEGWYEDSGLYGDMHSLHQDQDDASHVR